jgi:hypothetical protein
MCAVSGLRSDDTHAAARPNSEDEVPQLSPSLAHGVLSRNSSYVQFLRRVWGRSRAPAATQQRPLPRRVPCDGCAGRQTSARVSIPGGFPHQNTLASKSATSSEAPSFRCQDVFLHHLPARGVSLGRDWPLSAGCALAHVAPRVATRGDCGVRRHRTSHPPKLPLSPPKRASGRLCLRFHETCANQSDVETARNFLASSAVA